MLFREWRERHPTIEAVAFFFAGFAFDLLMLHRIDSVPMLIHQGTYNLALAVLLVLDHRLEVRPTTYEGVRAKLVGWRQGLIHFLFGTLLNAYIVFYFRAASGVISLAFIVAIGGLLIANELPSVRKRGPIVRFALLGFSWASFLAYLLPTIVGFISQWLFYIAIAGSALTSYVIWRITSRVSRDPAWTFRRGALPALAIQAALLVLYLLKVVPPVPLALRGIGVAYDVVPEGGGLTLTTLTPAWKFWRQGDQTFYARQGDKVHVYARIFAPRGFKDSLYVRWAHLGSTGWEESDRIRLTIKGGEREWRGWAYKQNYSPGEWQVRVETDDGRALGHLAFDIETDTSSGARDFLTRRE